MPPPIPPPQFTSPIPPVCFYNIQGFIGWLNTPPNNQYKYLFPELGVLPQTSSLSSIGYKPENVPIPPIVTTLGSNEHLRYNQELLLFYKVYRHNSNAYVDYITNNTPGPIYYNFTSSRELSNYNAAVQLINKLYPGNYMRRVGLVIPFPIGA